MTQSEALQKVLDGKKLTKEWLVIEESFKTEEEAKAFQRRKKAIGFECKLQKLNVTAVHYICKKCGSFRDIDEPCLNLNCNEKFNPSKNIRPDGSKRNRTKRKVSKS